MESKNNPLFTRREGKYELAGRLEAVQIEWFSHNKSGRGHLIHETDVEDRGGIMVRNGTLTLNPDRKCLARFDNRDRTTKANFIASDIPEGFRGLGPLDCIFYGQWPTNGREKVIPSLFKLNQYYDTGHCCKALYLSQFFGVCVIHPHGSKVLGHNRYGDVITYALPNPRIASRLVVGESKEDLEYFVKKIIERGYVPIKLDNLMENQRRSIYGDVPDKEEEPDVQ